MSVIVEYFSVSIDTIFIVKKYTEHHISVSVS